MKLFKDCPRVLLQKLFITVLLGTGCFVVGAAYYAATQDTVFLVLSIFLSVSCLLRSYHLYRRLAREQYSVTDGVCIGITPKPLRRYRRVRLMDAQGLETSLLLDKHTRVRIGYRYRIYFKKDGQLSFGSEYLDTTLSGDCFLGIEELGEFSLDNDGKTVLTENTQQK